MMGGRITSAYYLCCKYAQHLYHCSWHNTTWTQQDVNACLAWHSYRINNPTPKACLIVTGDSVAVGQGVLGATTVTEIYGISSAAPYDIASIVGANLNIHAANSGYGGTTTETTLSNAYAQVGQQVSPLFAATICYPHQGYNSLQNGDSAATASAAYSKLIKTYEGYGALTVSSTYEDAQQIDSNAAGQKRGDYNIAVASAVPSVAGLRNFQAIDQDATIGVAGSYSNSTYFYQESPNTVHLTAAGYAILAPYLQAGVSALIASLNTNARIIGG